MWNCYWSHITIGYLDWGSGLWPNLTQWVVVGVGAQGFLAQGPLSHYAIVFWV